MRNPTNFSVVMYGIYDTSFVDDNGGYHHPVKDKTGVIYKDGVTIELNEEEIKKVVIAFGGNFRA